MPPRDDMIERTLSALDKLMKMFAVERILYLICAIVSFVLLLVCLISLFQTRQISVPQLAMVFGASGLIAASAARVSFFLNKSFDLVAKIIERLASEEKK